MIHAVPLFNKSSVCVGNSNFSKLKLIPKNKYFDMTDLINAAKKRKKKIGVFPIDENEWVDVGQWEEYEKAKSRLE